MSDDDDWEFTALEEDKRTVPELVIEVGGKSYADAVLQQCSKVEIVKVVAMPHEVVDEGKPTFMKVKPGRKHEVKRHHSNKVTKEEKCVSGILKRENANVEVAPNQTPMSSLAEEFALSEACLEMMAEFDHSRSKRMPYTALFTK